MLKHLVSKGMKKLTSRHYCWLCLLDPKIQEKQASLQLCTECATTSIIPFAYLFVVTETIEQYREQFFY
uniref:Putative ovule protein n=1 Tax=Solanum chacoense TaxID=4108 RepID=A0A0V0HVN4_SOLCH